MILGTIPTCVSCRKGTGIVPIRSGARTFSVCEGCVIMGEGMTVDYPKLAKRLLAFARRNASSWAFLESYEDIDVRALTVYLERIGARYGGTVTVTLPSKGLLVKYVKRT